MKNLSKTLIALGAIFILGTLAVLAYLVHWAFGSMVTGIILLGAGGIVPTEE